MLRLIDTPSPWPLIHSSPSPSSPPASPPASRHPASLPRLACFSRSGCPHPAHASTASTSSCLAALARCVPCFRLPWSPSTWRVATNRSGRWCQRTPKTAWSSLAARHFEIDVIMSPFDSILPTRPKRLDVVSVCGTAGPSCGSIICTRP